MAFQCRCRRDKAVLTLHPSYFDLVKEKLDAWKAAEGADKDILSLLAALASPASDALESDIEGSDSEAERIIAEFEDAPKSPSSARSAPSSPPSSPNSGRSDQRINGAEDTSFRALGGDLKANKEVTGLDASWILEDALLVWHEAAMATGVDLPICKRCARRLAIEQREKIKEYEIEIKRMEDVRKALSEEEPAQTAEEMEAEITQLKTEIATLCEDEEFRKERALFERQESFLKHAEERLFEIEGKYWKERNMKDLEMQEDDATLDHIKSLGLREERLLTQLRSSFALNDFFPIWHNGHFGTICGFRLGRIESVPVTWEEINAALGFTALLVSTIANLLRYEFKQFRFLLQGSLTRLQSIKDGAIFELSVLIMLFFFLILIRFDAALAALLTCLNELAGHIHLSFPDFSLPYAINGDEIGGYSVKRGQFSSDERWSKALKFLLTNLKQIVAHMAEHGPV